MGDTAINKGPHDVGGEAGGAIDTIDHGMTFWERQANGLRSVISGKRIVRTDELRRAAEDLPNYSALAYFERTTMALRTTLLEKGYFSEAELKAKMDEIRARFNVPDEMESPLKQAAKK